MLRLVLISVLWFYDGENLFAFQHDGVEQEDDWFLQEVVVRNTTSDPVVKWKFPCGKWLSIHQPPDFQAGRKLAASAADKVIKTGINQNSIFFPQFRVFQICGFLEYEVTVHTADKSGAGTSANVFVTIYGELKCTPRLQLKRKSKYDFDRGKIETFRIPSISVGDVKKIKFVISHTFFRYLY